ncbi:MAG: hypothetical protein AAFW76_08445 [Pseudomonadota bacterium]
MSECVPSTIGFEELSDLAGLGPDRFPVDPVEFSALLGGTNINPETFLATDFLNNLNELIMMIGLAADMPDILDEIREWRPLSYADHFAHSGFPHSELAIAGWRRAEPARRAAIEQLVDGITGQIDATVEHFDICLGMGDQSAFADLCNQTRKKLMVLHDWGAGVIQGTDALNVAEVDALFRQVHG